MADGTVTIETKLDNSGAEKGLNDLKKEVESSSKSTAQEIDKASDQAQKSVEEENWKTSRKERKGFSIESRTGSKTRG